MWRCVASVQNCTRMAETIVFTALVSPAYLALHRPDLRPAPDLHALFPHFPPVHHHLHRDLQQGLLRHFLYKRALRQGRRHFHLRAQPPRARVSLHNRMAVNRKSCLQHPKHGDFLSSLPARYRPLPICTTLLPIPPPVLQIGATASPPQCHATLPLTHLSTPTLITCFAPFCSARESFYKNTTSTLSAHIPAAGLSLPARSPRSNVESPLQMTTLKWAARTSRAPPLQVR
jgi:hypothetical protein